MLLIDEKEDVVREVPLNMELGPRGFSVGELLLTIVHKLLFSLEVWLVRRNRRKNKHPRLTGKEARMVNQIYREAAALVQSVIVRQTSRLMLPDVVRSRDGSVSTTKRWLVVDHLTERIVKGFHHGCFLQRFYYESAHSDIAAIQRGMFENIINCLYLLQGDAVEFERWFQHGVKEELKRNRAIKQWMDSECARTRAQATREFDRSLEEWGTQFDQAKHSSIENLEQRAKRAGHGTDVNWGYHYDSFYRGLSSWSHGDSTRLFVSSQFQNIVREEEGRAAFESAAMVSRSYTMLTDYARTLCKKAGATTDLAAIEQKEAELDASVGAIMAPALDRFNRRSRPTDGALHSKNS